MAKCPKESQEESAAMQALDGFNNAVPNLCPGQKDYGEAGPGDLSERSQIRPFACQMGTVGLSSAPSHLP